LWVIVVNVFRKKTDYTNLENVYHCYFRTVLLLNTLKKHALSQPGGESQAVLKEWHVIFCGFHYDMNIDCCIDILNWVLISGDDWFVVEGGTKNFHEFPPPGVLLDRPMARPHHDRHPRH